jgi:hypothetical protein
MDWITRAGGEERAGETHQLPTLLLLNAGREIHGEIDCPVDSTARFYTVIVGMQVVMERPGGAA